MNHFGRWKSCWTLVITVASLCLSLESAFAANACYKVYDSQGKLRYEGRQAPVDIQNMHSESWGQLRRRGEHVVWYTSANCPADLPQATRSKIGRNADGLSNAELILGRTQSFAGK